MNGGKTYCYLKCERCNKLFSMPILSYSDACSLTMPGKTISIEVFVGKDHTGIKMIFGHTVCDECYDEYKNLLETRDKEWNEFISDWFREKEGNKI